MGMNHVTQIECLGGYCVRAIFEDGATGEYDFAEIVRRDGPMVEPLRDLSFFARVFLAHGAPTWPNGYDACPDWLRFEIKNLRHI